jgi:hypothetical protein
MRGYPRQAPVATAQQPGIVHTICGEVVAARAVLRHFPSAGGHLQMPFSMADPTAGGIECRAASAQRH